MPQKPLSHSQKHLVNPIVIIELRMERHPELISVPNSHYVAANPGEHLNLLAHLGNKRRSNERHGHVFLPRKGGVRMKTPQLPAIGVASNRYGHHGEPASPAIRCTFNPIGKVASLREDELFEEAKQLQVSCDLVRFVHENGKLPVVNFAAGGVATPADAALMMQLGAEGVFVGSGIFKSGDPAKRAQAIVKAVANYGDAEMIASLSENLGAAMVGINEQEIDLLMAERGK